MMPNPTYRRPRIRPQPEPAVTDVELLLTPDELAEVRRAVGVYLEMDSAATVRDPTPSQAGRALAGIVAAWLAMVDAQRPRPRHDRRYGPDGLTDRQREILRAIASTGGPMRIEDLATRLGVTAGGIADTLAILERRGEIRRCRHLGRPGVAAL